MEAVSEIDVVVSVLQNVRNNIDKPHDEWYHEVEEVCSALGAAPSLPMRCDRQEHRNNMPAGDPSTYYRRCISVSMVDHLLSEQHTKFSSHYQTAMLGLSLVPSALVTLPADDVKSNLTKLVDFYTEDVHSSGNVNSELHSWTVEWEL